MPDKFIWHFIAFILITRVTDYKFIPASIQVLPEFQRIKMIKCPSAFSMKRLSTIPAMCLQIAVFPLQLRGPSVHLMITIGAF